MNVKIKKLFPSAKMPIYATEGAACFDIHALEDGQVGAYGCSASVGTGLAFEIPDGWVMKVYSRSGHGFKSGVRLVNSVGVIDSDYRGEVMVGLRNDSAKVFEFKAGDRIAQAMIEPVHRITFEDSKVLSETERGAAGFGSTGG
jgi:dUTP pyrophosphatase